MRKIIFLTSLLLIFITSTVIAAELKLYRNQEYQFSIEIPFEFSYVTPRGPNVKMSASNQEGSANMNIIIKPSPFKNLDELSLKEIATIQKSMFTKDTLLIDEGSTAINNIPAYWFLTLNHYKYPNSEFYLASLQFQFVTNYKYYYISYFSQPELYLDYKNTFVNSVSSFVDETGWY